MPMLYHLIYTSSVTVKLSELNLGNLLFQSRRNNLRDNITGILLCTPGSFIQYIEGTKKDILNLLEKIKLDSRHYNLDIIAQGNIDKRNFGCWRMQYHVFPQGELEQMVGCQKIAQSHDAIKRTVSLIKLFRPAA